MPIEHPAGSTNVSSIVRIALQTAGSFCGFYDEGQVCSTKEADLPFGPSNGADLSDSPRLVWTNADGSQSLAVSNTFAETFVKFLSSFYEQSGGKIFFQQQGPSGGGSIFEFIFGPSNSTCLTPGSTPGPTPGSTTTPSTTSTTQIPGTTTTQIPSTTTTFMNCSVDWFFEQAQKCGIELPCSSTQPSSTTTTLSTTTTSTTALSTTTSDLPPDIIIVPGNNTNCTTENLLSIVRYFGDTCNITLDKDDNNTPCPPIPTPNDDNDWWKYVVGAIAGAGTVGIIWLLTRRCNKDKEAAVDEEAPAEPDVAALRQQVAQLTAEKATLTDEKALLATTLETAQAEAERTNQELTTRATAVEFRAGLAAAQEDRQIAALKEENRILRERPTIEVVREVERVVEVDNPALLQRIQELKQKLAEQPPEVVNEIEVERVVEVDNPALLQRIQELEKAATAQEQTPPIAAAIAKPKPNTTEQGIQTTVPVLNQATQTGIHELMAQTPLHSRKKSQLNFNMLYQTRRQSHVLSGANMGIPISGESSPVLCDIIFCSNRSIMEQSLMRYHDLQREQNKRRASLHVCLTDDQKQVQLVYQFERLTKSNLEQKIDGKGSCGFYRPEAYLCKQSPLQAMINACHQNKVISSQDRAECRQTIPSGVSRSKKEEIANTRDLELIATQTFYRDYGIRLSSKVSVKPREEDNDVTTAASSKKKTASIAFMGTDDLLRGGPVTFTPGHESDDSTNEEEAAAACATDGHELPTEDEQLRLATEASLQDTHPIDSMTDEHNSGNEHDAASAAAFPASTHVLNGEEHDSSNESDAELEFLVGSAVSSATSAPHNGREGTPTYAQESSL